MRGESLQASRKQFALGEARMHCVMCDCLSEKWRNWGRAPAGKPTSTGAALGRFRVSDDAMKRVVEKFDRSVGLQFRLFTVPSRSPSVPMKLPFTDPLEDIG